MTAVTPPNFLQAGSHPADQVRRQLSSMVGSRPGIVQSTDLAVTQNGTPNMSVLVAAGSAWVRGSESALQGNYFCEVIAPVNVPIAASDPTNPRRDLVCLQVRDSAYSGASNDHQVTVVQGTPAASPADPTLAANMFVLARVLVPAASSTVVNANITDMRTTPSVYAGNRGGRAAALGGTVVCTSTTRPQDVFTGLLIYETDTGALRIWNGTAWIDVAAAPQPGAPAWTSYTPQMGYGLTPFLPGSISSPSGNFVRIGRTIHFRCSGSMAPLSPGFGGSELIMRLPVTQAGSTAAIVAFISPPAGGASRVAIGRIRLLTDNLFGFNLADGQQQSGPNTAPITFEVAGTFEAASA